MASLEALQDRFQRTVVFLMRVRLDDRADALGKVLTVLSSVGARAGEVSKIEHLARHIVYDIQVFSAGDEQMAQIVLTEQQIGIPAGLEMRVFS